MPRRWWCREAKRHSTHLVAAACVLVIGVAVADAQEDSPAPGLAEAGRLLLREISPLLVPKVIGDCALLKEYIRSEEFDAFRRRNGDRIAVDAIYQRALDLSWGNVSEGLLISFAATMDHKRVGVRLPVLGPLLWFPLTSEFSGEYADRLRDLPSQLYSDTPHDTGGDRDKLQHFFGSAWLAYSMEANDPAERIGDFIEWGEERFIVGGVNDERDKRSNRHGRSFGLRLLVDETALPSEFMKVIAGEAQESLMRACVPDTECSGWEER